MKLTRSILALPLAAMTLFAVVTACSSKPEAEPGTECTPNKQVFCRCADRSQGEKTCGEDGKWGPCEPCFGDGPGPDPSSTSTTDPFPPDEEDAAADASRPEGCGNGTLDPGEACDDNNDVAKDGCGLQCVPEGDVAATRACPGLAVHVWDKPVTFSVATADPAPNTFRVATQCGGATGGTAPDRIYQVHAHKSGKLKAATTGATFNVMLYTSNGCAPGAITSTACVNAVDKVGEETLVVDVKENDKLTLFVDGASSNQAGSLALTLTIE